VNDGLDRSINDIFKHVRAGRIDDAETLCRRVLKHTPDDVNALGMLGAILLRQGHTDAAEVMLIRTIELEPGFAKPYEDLGVLYLDRGDALKALRFLEKAISLNPDNASAHRIMAVALLQLGRADEADAARRRFFALAPGADPLGEAEMHRQNGDAAQAEQICGKILEREPENVGALRTLAVVANDDERFTVAEGLFRRIVKLAPGSASALSDLGRFLGEQGRFSEAIEVLRQAAAIATSDTRIRQSLGDMLAITGRPAEALAAYDECLQNNPDDPAALAGRGHMLRVAGRKGEAIDCYRRAIDARPDEGQAWWNLASVHGYAFNDSNVAEMQQLAASAGLSPEAEIPLRFALGRALEQRGNYTGAWEEYVRANEIKRATVRYDPVETEVFHRKILDTFTLELARRDQAPPPTDRTPIFIVGMPRSGSTLIEQVLASHSKVCGLGQLPYLVMISRALRVKYDDRLRYPEAVAELDTGQLAGVGRSYLHYAASHRDIDRPFFTDKMPANFSHVGLIHMILPHAKIIDVRRDPLATCVANFRYLFAQGKNYTYDLVELAEYYRLYDEMMRHWDAVLPGAVLRVKYERIVADLDREVKRMLEFCELPFEQSCLDFYETERPINTASAEQARQPVYDSAVGFWKDYESFLDEVKEILAPVLNAND